MIGAAAELQAAALAALEAAAGIGGVYPGPPVQAAFPYAMVECGPETDWSHKEAKGREVRLAVVIRDKGERPGRVQALLGEAEAALETLAGTIGGWRLVSFNFLRSRLVKDGGGSWAGTVEFRARLLALQ
ncbi:MAG TPA: DUF3168 domain-containing protein [Allosphingosinicella sp.]|jgi:hypothetical protein